MSETWIIKYVDGTFVGNGGVEASSVSGAKRFESEGEAFATVAILNEGLYENHLGRAFVERFSDNTIDPAVDS